jgi:hypothetical protein
MLLTSFLFPLRLRGDEGGLKKTIYLDKRDLNIYPLQKNFPRSPKILTNRSLY